MSNHHLRNKELSLKAKGLLSQMLSLPEDWDYDSPGPVSHVGIYVGDGMMLHCGSPIQYANINSSYWQTHFYAFGRL